MFKIMKVNSFFDFFGNFLLGFEPRYLLGDKLFLDDVYVMAKFNELNSECSYPSSTERSRHIDSIYNSLISKF